MIASVVTGNLGKDAVKREHEGNVVLSFSVASRRFDSQKKEEVTDWVDVSFWGKRGDKLAQYLTKGSRVAVRGHVWVREFTHNGEKRFALSCRADDVELLGSKPDGAKSDSGSAPSQASDAPGDAAGDGDGGIPF